MEFVKVCEHLQEEAPTPNLEWTIIGYILVWTILHMASLHILATLCMFLYVFDQEDRPTILQTYTYSQLTNRSTQTTQAHNYEPLKGQLDEQEWNTLT